MLRQEIPFWEKSNLTVEEAAAYFNVGIHRIKKLTESDNCPFVLWCGSKRLIKKKAFEQYLERTFSV